MSFFHSGTSGVIYSLLLTGIAEAMAEHQYEYRKKHNKELPLDDFAVWGKVLEQGVRTVMKYSLAGVGDRTLLDGELMKTFYSNPSNFI